ncbi:MAG: pilus assembly protein [Roseovarius sp.]|nr:pilus assembly protein [Roseovarius sp.]
MVSRSLIRRFWRDDGGLALTEALLTIPIMLLVLAAMVEFGVAVFQWNQATKAVQIGARRAVVSSPIVGDAAYASLGDFSASGTLPGDPVPVVPASVSCRGATCNTVRLNRLLTGGDGVCGAVGGGFVGMCDVAPFLRAENVMVTYHRSFLGYVGRPYGQVSTVTVELRDVTVDFVLIDTLLGIDNITIPSQPVSMTSEDLCDTSAICEY